MNENKEIKTLKGIGDKTAELYNKVGIYTYGDLMYYFPRDYMKYDTPAVPGPESIGRFIFTRVRLKGRPLMRKAGRMAVVTASAVSEGGSMRVVWFHMPYLTKRLKAGTDYIFAGTLKRQGSDWSMEQPLIFTNDEYEKVKDTLQPIYPLTKGLTNNAVKKAVKQVLSDVRAEGKVGSLTLDKALRGIHFPEDTEELREAREALVYDEFLMFILKVRMLREENNRAANSFRIKRSGEVSHITESLPYDLTKAQLKAFKDVENDMSGVHAMSRLIQGDVGCGKTIIAILACIDAVMSGYQCAVMVPTEILASQHFESFTEIFARYGICPDADTSKSSVKDPDAYTGESNNTSKDNNLDTSHGICLLTGSMKASGKRKAYEDIKSGRAKVIIGTHALFQEKVEYKNLALVITDEQHRFGVRQRSMLVEKGNMELNERIPHVLVMSATPIPRTLAIMLYGDLDISVIDEVPARRLPVKNCVVGTDYRQRAYRFIEKEVKAGHQAYVICPLVEESEGLDCEDVISYTDRLKEALGSDINIATLHGQMKPALKDKVMKDFLDGKTDVLVSTTVVEVGVNVPNATVMMIENSERFGLAQLHQLRGRIGRGDAQSYCIFINCSESEKSKTRLEILNHSNDGFRIASEDLKLRGPGDMFGIRQSGEMQFRLGDVFSDAPLLERASKAAAAILEDDPMLEKEENAYLRERIEKDTRLNRVSF